MPSTHKDINDLDQESGSYLHLWNPQFYKIYSVEQEKNRKFRKFFVCISCLIFSDMDSYYIRQIIFFVSLKKVFSMFLERNKKA